MHYFSSLALTLNEPEDGVAPTDSRLRPDQRLMEAGLWDEANTEKQRLEERQRLERRKREAQANLTLEEGKTEPHTLILFHTLSRQCTIQTVGEYLTKDVLSWI